MELKIQKEIMTQQGCAIILAGSDSDEEHIKRIIKSLEEYEISYETIICSAHKQTAELMKIIEDLNTLSGAVVYITVAGGTDALSGTLSFYALAPVISCPPDSPNLTVLTNPPGSSNATILNPGNVGKFVAQIFCAINTKYAGLIREKNAKKIEKLKNNGKKIRNNYTRIFKND
jgi:5-(carboxyamino)imidazole ribonucleotide mutase